MLVLLPPSETKAPGGDGAPLDLDALSFPALNPCRARLVDALVALAADPDAARGALGLSAGQAHEVARNAALWEAATAPALRRYTGVLYDALGYPSLPAGARRRADQMLVVVSALFGALRPGDPVPAYRLSGGSVLPTVGPLPAYWRPALGPLLAAYDGLVVDLRSGAYAALAPLPGAVRVRVLCERPDGSRAVVSHHNKTHKGRLARTLVSSRAHIDDVRSLLRVIRRAGFVVEPRDDRSLDLIVPA